MESCGKGHSQQVPALVTCSCNAALLAGPACGVLCGWRGALRSRYRGFLARRQLGRPRPCGRVRDFLVSLSLAVATLT